MREVKEYAARASEINVDTLQLKLMHLDKVARRASHDNRELYALTLQRFLCHKQNPKIWFLITSLLSSPAETKLFEKEQKFLKLHGKQDTQQACKRENKEEIEKEKKSTPDFERHLSASVGAQPFFYPMMSLPGRAIHPCIDHQSVPEGVRADQDRGIPDRVLQAVSSAMIFHTIKRFVTKSKFGEILSVDIFLPGV